MARKRWCWTPISLPAPVPCGSIGGTCLKSGASKVALNLTPCCKDHHKVGRTLHRCFSPKPISLQVSLLPSANSFPITKETSSEEHLPLEGHTWLHPLSSCHGPGLVLSPLASFSGAQLPMTFSGPQYQACRAAHFSSPCSPVSLRKCVLLGHMALPAHTGCLPGPGTALLSQARPGSGGGKRASPVCFSHRKPGQTDSNKEIHGRTENRRPGCP